MYQTILFEVKDQVGIITLNIPAKMNALSFLMIDELHQLLDTIEKDKEIRALMIWGGQEKFFCAGGDLDDQSDMTIAKSYDISRKSQKLYDRIEQLKIPTIAAVGGMAFGGGVEIALSCDFRIINAKAKMGMTEATLGLIPGGGGTVRLRKIVGLAKAKELICLGRIVRAEEAVQCGLANRCCEAGELYDSALAFAKEFLKPAPISVAVVKDLLNRGADMPDDAAYDLEAYAYAMILGTKDAAEGLAAFKEKRSPVYTGE